MTNTRLQGPRQPRALATAPDCWMANSFFVIDRDRRVVQWAAFLDEACTQVVLVVEVPWGDNPDWSDEHSALWGARDIAAWHVRHDTRAYLN